MPYMADSLPVRINLANFNLCSWGKKDKRFKKYRLFCLPLRTVSVFPLRSMRW